MTHPEQMPPGPGVPQGETNWHRDAVGRRVFVNVVVLIALSLGLAAAGSSVLASSGHYPAAMVFVLALVVAGVYFIYRAIVPVFHQMNDIKRRLEESSRRTELLLRNAGQGIYGMDVDGRATFVNAAAERLLGYRGNEIIGKNVHELIHHSHADGRHHPVGECPVHRAVRDGVVARVEADAFWRRDGRKLDVAYVAAPVVEDGRVTGAVVLFDDITDRLRVEAGRQAAEARLRESEASLVHAQEQARLGSWRFDIGNRRLYCSDEARRILGVPPDMPINLERYLDRVHPDDRLYVETEWRTAQRGGSHDIQFRLRVDGRVKWVRERVGPEISADGALTHGIGTLQDITELKSREEETLRSRQLLRELAAHSERVREIERSRIAREIHDELGQYLTALRMDIAMLNIRHGADHPDMAEQIKVMKDTIDTTIGVVRHIAATLRPAALDMGLTSATEWLLATFQERTGVQCRLETPDEELDLGEERTTAVFRILQESLTNITRHAKARHVSVVLAHDDGELCMQVVDDGVGFDAQLARQKKTFGLMGIRERALVFGGESRLDSRPGAGTTLTVRIPLEEPPKP